MSMGGGSTSSSSNSTVPLFQGQLQPMVSKMLGGFDPSGGPLRAAAQGAVSDTLAGKYMDPSSNPGLSGVLSGIETGAKRSLATSLAGINQGAAAGGTLLSSKNAQNQDLAAQRSAQDVASQESQVLSQNYSQERGLQSQAANQGAAMSSQNLNQLLDFLGVLKGGTSSSASDGFNFSL